MNVRPIAPVELSAARDLLVAADLPVDDLADPAIELAAAFTDGAMLGVIGLERRDPVGLLRSLAVAPSARGAGIARALCAYVFERAAAERLTGLWLLTTTARDYFTRQGFVVVDRATAPAPIQATAQFASLCPASAIVMHRPRA